MCTIIIIRQKKSIVYLTLGVRRSFTIQIVHHVPKFGPILLYRENENYMPEATPESDADAAFTHTLRLRHSFFDIYCAHIIGVFLS